MKITKSMIKFLSTKILPNYILYSKNEGYAFCTACQSEVNINAFKKTKPLLEVKCPHCKATAKMKAKGQTKYRFMDSGVGIILDKDDDICIRYFDVERVYNTDGSIFRFNYKECMREYFNDKGEYVTFDNVDNWKKCNIRQYSNYKGREGDPVLHINTNWKYRNIYNGNMKSVIKNTPWQYSLMNEIFKLPDEHHYWNTVRVFLFDYLQSPVDEYLYKVGFKELCSYSVFTGYLPIDIKEKTLPKILMVNKDEYNKLLQNGNPTRKDLIKSQTISRYNLKDGEFEILDRCFPKEEYGQPSVRNDYEQYKNLCGLSLKAFEKYRSDVAFSLWEYFDYLRMCKDLGYDTKNTFVAFPKHFKEAHNDVVKKWNKQKNKLEREKAKKRNNEYYELRDKYTELYSFEENNLKIVVPNGCDDICAEGQKLHHCVGTYIDKVCKGISVILFVRDITNLAKSFYTMEIRDGEMIQCRGFGNKAVTPEVRTFIEDFAKQRNVKMNRYVA